MIGTELELCVGHEVDRSLMFKRVGALEDERRLGGHVITGRLSTWKRVALRTGVVNDTGTTYRFFVLEPGPTPNEIKHGPFYVRGRFHVTETINNPRAAREAFNDFEPA